MKKLFIIGNGFDLSHGLATSYDDFRQFLDKRYPMKFKTSHKFTIPKYNISIDDGFYYEEHQIISLLFGFIPRDEDENKEKLWKNFETNLGKIYFSLYFNSTKNAITNSSGEDIIEHKSICVGLMIACKHIVTLLNDWISKEDEKSIDFKYIDFIDLINSDECNFLSFNYTNTLERLYQIEKVLHIHGRATEKIVLGHGEKFDNKLLTNSIDDKGFEHINILHRTLRKDTSTIIEKHRDYFEVDLLNTKEIYSYGFSFSEVDMVYIEKICSVIQTKDVVWYLFDYNLEEQYEELVSKLISSGFLGNIKKFKVENKQKV